MWRRLFVTRCFMRLWKGHCKNMKNSYKFFSNRDCKYFPCHSLPDIDNFNCLLCFCPLYLLRDCGGNFKYTGAKRVKTCADCHLPHLPEYYDTVVSKLKDAETHIGHFDNRNL